MNGSRYLPLLYLLVAVAAPACASAHHGTRIVPSPKSQFPIREWSKLSEQQKVGVVSVAIDLARQDGTEIHLPPGYYVAELDSLRQTYVNTGNEDALDSSVGVTFKTIAIMEGDWGNGEGKVDQAKRVFGPELFEEFRTRYPDKYQHLIELDERSNAGATSN